MGFVRGWGAAWLVLLTVGCFDSHVGDDALPGSGPCSDGEPSYAAPPCEGDSCLDVLFVVDSRETMVEEQIGLFEQIPRLLRALLTGDRDGDGEQDFPPVEDLHFGVVTADLGSGGSMVPSCLSPDRGDDAIVGRGRAGRLDPSCGLELPDFLHWAPGEDPELGPFAHDAACLAAVGIFGCEYAQPLDSALKALSESDAAVSFHAGSCGHADGRNAGFLRRDSVLAVVVITDHDDCSVADAVFFADADPERSDASLYCTQNEELLHPPSRWVRGFSRLRDDPADLVFGVLAGVPPRLIEGPADDVDGILGDPDMSNRADPEDSTRLMPSCDVPGRGVSYPPRRLLAVLGGLADQGATTRVGSICQADFSPVLDGMLERLP